MVVVHVRCRLLWVVGELLPDDIARAVNDLLEVVSEHGPFRRAQMLRKKREVQGRKGSLLAAVMPGIGARDEVSHCGAR